MATEDDEDPVQDPPVWLRADKEGTVEQTTDPGRHVSGSETSHENAIWYMGATGQDNASAIFHGVQAWKVLTNGKGPLWRKFNREEMFKKTTNETAKVDSGEQDPLPPHHNQEEQDHPGNVDCPFTAMAHLGDEAKELRRPGPLPTPPPLDEHYVKRSTSHRSQSINKTSPPPSATGSTFKCPIRMLDERSPEEVAEYFETHKHEVPRSHAICVKRYQSNAQSIRQLDAKYGNLVNMLQGLGNKHQPLLPRHEEAEEHVEMDRKSLEKVDKWAGNVEETAGEAATQHRNSLPDTDERQGHFDRPLKEIRVGESPSRPWGIPMLGAEPSKLNIDGVEGAGQKHSGVKDSPGISHPPPQTKQGQSEDRSHQQKDDKAGVVFTGPVFIGYSAEQAADLIQKCGWDPNGPPK